VINDRVTANRENFTKPFALLIAFGSPYHKGVHRKSEQRRACRCVAESRKHDDLRHCGDLAIARPGTSSDVIVVRFIEIGCVTVKGGQPIYALRVRCFG